MAIGLAQTAALSPTPGEWLNAYISPQWTTGFLLVLPIISIGGSLWSLRIAFGQTSSRSNQSGSSLDSAGTSDGGGGSTSGTQPTSIPKPVPIKPGPLSVAKVGANTLQYPITSTFKILSIVVLLSWCIGLYTFTIRTPIGVRPTAVASLMLSIDVLAECLFETLLRRKKSKNAAPKPVESAMGEPK
ncbi:hypothetical protein BCR44DRAFT_1431043, partial [Catenaria anguillulae PL171]